jgi:large subunit ribosomal protein L25
MSAVQKEVNIKQRTEFGKGPSRRAVRNGEIPAIIYKKGEKSKTILVNAKEWDIATRKEVSLMGLVSEDGTKTQALIKEVQYDYLKNLVKHIDFQEVKTGEAIATFVPIHSIGDPIGLSQGGELEQPIREIEIEAIPSKLPEFIEVNVEDLGVDQSIHIGEVELPEGVVAVGDKNLIVFHVVK